MKKRVMWFSRHDMTESQMKALGDCEITKIDRTIQSAYELEKEISEHDVIAIVAPINLQAQFIKIAGNKPVIMAVNDRILKDDGSYEFVFNKWEQIDKIEVIKHDYQP